MISRTESITNWKYLLNEMLDGQKETLANDLEFMNHAFDPVESRGRCLSAGGKLEILMTEAE